MDRTTTCFFESVDKEPIFSKSEYTDFLKQSTEYKVELMGMVVNSLRQSFKQE